VIYLGLTMTLGTASVCLTVLVLNLHYRATFVPVPAWARLVLLLGPPGLPTSPPAWSATVPVPAYGPRSKTRRVSSYFWVRLGSPSPRRPPYRPASVPVPAWARLVFLRHGARLFGFCDHRTSTTMTAVNSTAHLHK